MTNDEGQRAGLDTDASAPSGDRVSQGVSNLLSQKEAIAAALKLYDRRPLAVSDIGSQSAWTKAASHDRRNLYISGPMGLASSVALGVAESRPNEEVLAICGDGALAMNFSSLITAAGMKTRNLAILVLVNGIYEYTASVPVPDRKLDWLGVGRALFSPDQCFTLADLTPERWKGVMRPAMIVADIAASVEQPPPLGMSPAQIRAAFLEASRASTA